MRGTITVIIPARNEEQSIAKVLRAIPSHVVDHIIVCDNGSTDQTSTIAAQEGAVIVFEPVPGYGAACLRALESLPDGTDIVVFLDADFSDDPSELPALIAPIEAGEFDLVLGSRIESAEPGALTPQQRFGNWLATRLLRVIYGRSFSDLGPFRAIRRTTLEKIAMKDRGMGWTVEMQLKTLRYGFRIKEVPVSYRPRIGKSKISGTISGSFRAGCKILFLIATEIFKKKPVSDLTEDQGGKLPGKG